MAASQARVLAALTRAIRPHVPRARDTATIIMAVSVRRAIPPLGGYAAGGIIRVSEPKKTASVIASRNAALRWSRLLNEGVQAVLLVTGQQVSPVFLALAGLVICQRLGSLATTKLNERHGVIIYVMWRRGGNVTSQRPELLLPEVNAELRTLEKKRMTMRELRDRLSELTELGCLTPTISGWRLKDRVWLTVRR